MQKAQHHKHITPSIHNYCYIIDMNLANL